MSRKRAVKGGPDDTGRTGGTEIPTKGLRYSKPSGGTRRIQGQPEDWECPDEGCGHTNERWRVQCERCGWNQRRGAPSLER